MKQRSTFFTTLFAILMIVSFSSVTLAQMETSNIGKFFVSGSDLRGASTAQIQSTDIGTNVKFDNPYNPGNIMYVFAGTFKGTLDGENVNFYCIDIGHGLVYNQDYTDDGATPEEITYILNHYYPYVSYPYNGSASSVNKEAAAVQVAIWHFSDGVDASTVSNNDDVKARALEIIADADANAGSFIAPETLVITPISQTLPDGATANFIVGVYDINGDPVQGIDIDLSSTSGSLSASQVTSGVDGTATFSLDQGGSSTATVTALAEVIIPQGTKYVHVADPNGKQKLVLATPAISTGNAQADVEWYTPNNDCDINGYTTFTQGGWGSPSNSTPGQIRDAYFDTVFPTGLVVGSTYTLTLTSAQDVKDFLPQGGSPGPLTQNYVNPGSGNITVFAGQVVAATLNVEYQEAGYLGANAFPMGDLIITTGPLAGKTVDEMLAYANTALGGGSTPYSYSQLNDAATALNENFDNGTVDNGFLDCPNAQCDNKIGDFIWHDRDVDGIQDAGEEGIEGIAVELLDNTGGVIATTTSDFNGKYEFAGVANGDYTVRLAASNFAQGGVLYSSASEKWYASPKDAGGDDAVDSDGDANHTAAVSLDCADDLTIDFGFYKSCVSITKSGPATVNAGETITYEFTVTNCGDLVLAGGASVFDALINPDGNHQIAHKSPVNPGEVWSFQKTYTTDVDDCGQLPNTANVVGHPKLPDGTYVDNVEDNDTWTVSVICQNESSLGDFVWHDRDVDGIQDAGEEGIEDVFVELLDNTGGVIATTTTDANGKYGFSGLSNGVYTVRLAASNFALGGVLYSSASEKWYASPKDAGSDDAVDSDGDANHSTSVTINNADDLTLDFGFYKSCVSITKSGPATVNSGETITYEFTVTNCGDLVLAGGASVYDALINPDGNHQIAHKSPVNPGQVWTFQKTYTTDDSDCGQLPNTANVVGHPKLPDGTYVDNVEDNDTWTVDVICQDKASLGDKVWIDANENGTQDNGELGLQGVTVNLYDCGDQFIATTTTDGNGNYLFANLTPGDYYVEFILPTAYYFTSQDQGSDDAIDSDADVTTGKTVCTTLTSGENDMTWDAGAYEMPEASIGDKVWIDANENGAQDNGESGLQGVTVKLYNCAGSLLNTTVTDANGNYLFDNLNGGDYKLQFFLPNGYVFTTKDAGTDDAVDSDAEELTGMTDCTTLSPGEDDMTWDAGLVAVPENAEIGDKVWVDTNQNGIQDGGEAGYPGVTVKLFDCSGGLISTTVTDGSGNYLFGSLPAGDYKIQFVLPSGYTFSPQDAGSDDAVDSDADVTSGMTICTTLDASEIDHTWDAGIYEIPENADLSIVKTVDNDNPEDGDAVTFTITVTNNGSADATGIEVTDILPAGLDFTTATPSQGLYDHTTGIWNVGDLASGSSASMAIDCVVDVDDCQTTAIDLGPATGFNVFVWKDINQPSSDTEGKMAIGRDAYLSNYSVGDKLGAAYANKDVLIVGRDLYYTSGHIYFGDVAYGGATNLPVGTVSMDGTLRQDGSVIDFNAARVYLQSLSSTLAGYTVEGTTTYQWSGVFLDGADPFLNVFDVDGAELTNSTYMDISVPNGAVVIVNISGDNIVWSGGLTVSGTDINNVLYNFPNARNLTIQGIDIRGSVLAPKAHVNFPTGLISGQFIAKSMEGAGQFNNHLFGGNIPCEAVITNIAEITDFSPLDPDLGNNSSSATVTIGGDNDPGGDPGNDDDNWEYAGNFDFGEIVWSLAGDAAGNMYAGTMGGHIYFSSDDGANWTLINDGMGAAFIWSIAVDNTNGKIWVATEKGVFISTDNGAAWSLIGLAGMDVRSIVVAGEDHVFAGTWGFGVYELSSATSYEFVEANDGLTVTAVHALSVNSYGDIFAGTFGGGIYKLAFGADSWTSLDVGFDFVWSIGITSDDVIFAGTYGNGVMVSFDGGTSWDALNDGLPGMFVYSIAVDAADNVYVTTWTGGVYVLPGGNGSVKNGGNSIQTAVWTPVGMGGFGVSSLLINPNSSELYAGTSDGTIYRKVNSVTDVEEESEIPTKFELAQNYPNPFNPSTTVKFDIAKEGFFQINVYNILGEVVTTLLSKDLQPGQYEINFNANNLASGIYIYQLVGNDVKITKKMMLMK